MIIIWSSVPVVDIDLELRDLQDSFVLVNVFICNYDPVGPQGKLNRNGCDNGNRIIDEMEKGDLVILL